MDNQRNDSLPFWFVRFGFVGLTLAVFLFSMWNTWSLAQIVLPGDVIRAGLAVALFDLGIPVWFGVFVYASHGLSQRGVSLFAGAWSVVATLAANWFYFSIGGERSGIVSDTSSALWAMRTIELSMLVALSAGVLHFLFDPAIMSKIKAQARQDRVMELAGNMAARKIDEIANDVAGTIADDLRTNALRQLSALTGSNVIAHNPVNTQTLVVPHESVPVSREQVATFAQDAPAMPEVSVKSANPTPAPQ